MPAMFKSLIVSAFALTAACSAASAAGSGPRGKEGRVLRWVDAHTGEQIAFLEKDVNINSGTSNLEGVRASGALYQRQLDDLGMQTEWHELPAEMGRAGHLIARTKGRAGKRVLLIGHFDTVFEKSSPFQRFERDGDMAAGPGVIDMKGGNGVILYALLALHSQGLLHKLAITVVFTGDEEKPGSPLAVTRAPLIDAAREADVALGFESLVDHFDTATVARRGFSAWTLRIKGEQGHSSQIFSPHYGGGAIYEASRILEEFRRISTSQENLTMSPGRIVGGTQIDDDAGGELGTATGKRNVVPKEAQVVGDIRALTPLQLEETIAAMQKVVGENLPRTSATLAIEDGYPPMAPTNENNAVFSVLAGINRDLGRPELELVDPMRRGAADISFAAAHAPSLGGLGLYGTGDHSPKEKVDLRSVPVATKRAALLILRLASMPKDAKL